MTPVLTDQQRQALHETNDAGPVTVVDPATQTQYVLVRPATFRRVAAGGPRSGTRGRLSAGGSHYGGR